MFHLQHRRADAEAGNRVCALAHPVKDVSLIQSWGRARTTDATCGIAVGFDVRRMCKLLSTLFIPTDLDKRNKQQKKGSDLLDLLSYTPRFTVG